MAINTAHAGRTTLAERAQKQSLRKAREAPIYAFLFLCAGLSIVTTGAIVLVLFEETLHFFGEVSLGEFLTGTEWTPTFSNPHFGVLPLLSATMFIALLAMLIAVPIGLLAAIYLSEYASPRVRGFIKPILEVLAGIPTIVYGFFALTFISPEILKPLGQATSFSALAAAIVMGVMIIPMVSSLSEDAMRAVPRGLREGAYGLGCTKFEVATRVVLPAALSGITAACILAASRAVGETMIVAVAAGNQPNLSWNPFEQMQTMTAFIVQVALGDSPRGTIEYSTIFALGSLLFLSTLILNIFAQWMLSKFREEYE
jgi:phosphate transport system permease protein